MSDATPDTTGLREEACASPLFDWCRNCGRPSAEHPTPDASPDPAVVTPDAGDVEALARLVRAVIGRMSYRAAAEHILASDWLANHVAAAREADRAEAACEHGEFVRVDTAEKYRARAEAAEERLAGLVAKIEALADEPGSGFPYVQVADLRALIPADTATALDAVREKAKAEERERIAQAILDGCDDLAVQPCRTCRHAASIARHTPEAT